MVITLLKSTVVFVCAIYLFSIGIKNVYPAITFEPPKPMSLQEMNGFSKDLTIVEAIEIYTRRKNLIFSVRQKFTDICLAEQSNINNITGFLKNVNGCTNDLVKKHWRSLHSGFILKAIVFLLGGFCLLTSSIYMVNRGVNTFKENLEDKFTSESNSALVSKIFDTEHSDTLRKFKEELVDQNNKSRNNAIFLSIITTIVGVLLSYVLSFIS